MDEKHKQKEAEEALRARYRQLFQDLDEDKASLADLRAALLAEPGIELLNTRSGPGSIYRDQPADFDLLSYRKPGGPERPSYVVMEWSATGWEDRLCSSRDEADLCFLYPGRFPPWFEIPVLLDERDESNRRWEEARAKKQEAERLNAKK